MKNRVWTHSRQILALSLVLVLFSGYISLSAPLIQDVEASAQDPAYSVPIYWCAVQGSPATLPGFSMPGEYGPEVGREVTDAQQTEDGFEASMEVPPRPIDIGLNSILDSRVERVNRHTYTPYDTGITFWNSPARTDTACISLESLFEYLQPYLFMAATLDPAAESLFIQLIKELDSDDDGTVCFSPSEIAEIANIVYFAHPGTAAMMLSNEIMQILEQEGDVPDIEWVRHIPIIPDPFYGSIPHPWGGAPTGTKQGDVLMPASHTIGDPMAIELIVLLDACNQAYDEAGDPIPPESIIALNVNEFHDDKGEYDTAVGVGGHGYEGEHGWLAVTDDAHMYYASERGYHDDIMDLLLAHELGHVLRLDHIPPDRGLYEDKDYCNFVQFPEHMDNILCDYPEANLMYSLLQDTNNNGDYDNTVIHGPDSPARYQEALLDEHGYLTEVDELQKWAAKYGERVEGAGVERAATGRGAGASVTNERIKGDIVAKNIFATLNLSDNVPSHLKNSIMRVALDTQTNEVSLKQQLFGAIPDDTSKTQQYWILVDTDGDPNTGVSESELQRLGIPPTNFKGSDLVVRSNVSGDPDRQAAKAKMPEVAAPPNLAIESSPSDVVRSPLSGDQHQVDTQVWNLRGNNLVRLPANLYHSELVTNRGIADYLSSPSKSFDLNSVISTTINNNITKIDMGKPLNIQTISAQPAPAGEGFTVVDKLDKSTEERGKQIVLERPTFPVCLPHSDEPVRAGESVTIDVKGLKPGVNIEGLFHHAGAGRANETGGGEGGSGSIQSPVRSNATLANEVITQRSLPGPVPVFSGKANGTGGGTIQLPVPSDATSGLHLVTIGVEGTGSSAPCVVNVLDSQAQPTGQPTPLLRESTQRGAVNVPPSDDTTQTEPICPRVDLIKSDDGTTLEDVQFEWNPVNQQCQPPESGMTVGPDGAYRIQDAECPNQMQWDRTTRQCTSGASQFSTDLSPQNVSSVPMKAVIDERNRIVTITGAIDTQDNIITVKIPRLLEGTWTVIKSEVNHTPAPWKAWQISLGNNTRISDTGLALSAQFMNVTSDPDRDRIVFHNGEVVPGESVLKIFDIQQINAGEMILGHYRLPTAATPQEIREGFPQLQLPVIEYTLEPHIIKSSDDSSLPLPDSTRRGPGDGPLRDSTQGGPGDTTPPPRSDDDGPQGGPTCPRVDLMKNDGTTIEDVQFEWNAANQQCQPLDPSITLGQGGEYRIQNAECPNQMQWDRTTRQCA